MSRPTSQSRKLTMFNRVSMDGYFAGPHGEMDFVVPDHEVDRAGAQGIPGTDTMLLGRVTYELFERAWSNAGPSDEDPHQKGRVSPEQGNFAAAMNSMTKLVFSKTLKEVGWRNSRLVREFDPRAIAAMKREPGKDIVVLGSGTLVSQLTQHGLIDEYTLVISPKSIGSGRPLIAGVSKHTDLELIESKTFSSGNVLLRYARRN